MMTGACQNTQANFYLLSICNRRFVWLLFLRIGYHLLIIRPLKYNLNLTGDMSFLLISHLPRLVVMSAKIFICEGKVSNRMYYFYFYFFMFLLITKVNNTKC